MRKTLFILSGFAILACLAILFSSKNGSSEATIRDLVRDEEIVLELTRLTNKIAEAIHSGNLVTDDTHLLFADSISLVGVLPDPVVAELAGAQQGILEKRRGPAKSQTLS